MSSTASSSKGARGPSRPRTPGITSRSRTRAASARKPRNTARVSHSYQQPGSLPDDTPNQNKPHRVLSIHDQNAVLYESPTSTTISMHSEHLAIDPALGNTTFGNYSAEPWQRYPMDTYAIGAHLEIPRSYPNDEESNFDRNATFSYHEPYHVNNIGSLPNIDTSAPSVFANQPCPPDVSHPYTEPPTIYHYHELPQNHAFQPTYDMHEQIDYGFNQLSPTRPYGETMPAIDTENPSDRSLPEEDKQIYDKDQIQTGEIKYEGDIDEEKTTKVSEEGLSSKGKGEAVVFACPFFRLDHIRYMSCLNLKMTRIRDVKQHLQRRHYQVPIYCERCHIEFCSSEMLCAHIKRKNCKPRAQPVAMHLKGVSRVAQQQLKFPMHRTMALNDQWFKIWQILFPKEPRPGNPYLGTFLKETMDMIENFWRREGDAVTKKVIKANPSACKDGNNVNLIMAALLKEVRLQLEPPTQNTTPSGSLDSTSNSG